MSDANEQLVRSIFHEGTAVPLPEDEALRIFSPDFVCHGPPGVDHARGGLAHAPETCMFQDAFAVMTFAITEIGSTADQVKLRFEARGRQVALYRNVPPSSGVMSFAGTATVRVTGGRIAEGWGVLAAG